MATNPQSAEFSTEEKLAALLSALNTGAISQAQYDAQYAILTGTGPEPFSLAKFLEGMLSVLNPVNWAKDFAALFNIRRLIIIGVIIGAFCWGLRDRIPVFNLGNGSLQGKTFTINLGNGENLNLNSAGQLQVVDSKTGKVEKTVRVKDIPQLNAAIKPIGFQFKPIAVVGAGAGTASGFGLEGGAGVSWFKLYNLETDSFVTNKGLYPLGISYRLTKFAGGNSSIGIAPGIGWKGNDKRILVYFRLTF
jgi:hypothetical protein